MRYCVPVLTALCVWGVACAQDNAVYITAGDTSYFSPAGAISATGAPGKWFLRKVGFAARGDYILNPQAGVLLPDLTVNPKLTGRYNLYVNMREVNYVTGLQLKLSKEPLAYTVTPALGTADVHTNRDILFATDVDMTGQTILMRHIGQLLYFSDLKFVPVASDQPGLKVDPERVKQESLIDPRAEWAKTRDVVPEGMLQIKHLSDQPADPASDGGTGYVLYARPYLDLLFPDTVPSADEVVADLELSAARGEYEPVSFAVYATKDLADCRVTVTDLITGARRIPKTAINIAAVRCRNLRTYFCGKTWMNVPAMLDSTMPVAIPRDDSQQFWLTVHVPERATPGGYTGTITFSPGGGPARQLKLRLTVHPFALRPITNVALGMYDQRWAARTDEHWLQNRLADQRAHGMTTNGYCGQINAQMAMKDGVAQVVFDGQGGFEQFMDAYRDAGFPCPVLWLMDNDLWSWCAEQAEPGSERFGTCYKQVIQSILKESEKRRWPGIIFQPIDEPGSYEYRPNPGYIEQWALQSELIKQAGGTVEVDHIPFSTEDPRLKSALERALPCTDIFTERYSNQPIWFKDDGWWWGNMKEQAAKWGKQLWSYNINDGAFFPELPTMRLAYGYFVWLEQARGQITWSYQQVAENPLNALDGTYTDMMYSYPAIPEAGEPGGPSLMWECIREGTDDLRYLQTLEYAIGQAEAKGHKEKAAAARAVLQRLRQSFDDERLRAKDRFIECQWDESALEPSGAGTVKGRFNIPNGWTFADYDRWRSEIASQIRELMP